MSIHERCWFSHIIQEPRCRSCIWKDVPLLQYLYFHFIYAQFLFSITLRVNDYKLSNCLTDHFLDYNKICLVKKYMFWHQFPCFRKQVSCSNILKEQLCRKKCTIEKCISDRKVQLEGIC